MTAPRHILILLADSAELWRRRGRRLTRVTTITGDDDFSRHLGIILQRARVRSLGLLLTGPGLSLQFENTPLQVSRLDRLKLALHRLTFLQPGSALRGVAFLPDRRMQLAALRPTALLTATLAAVNRAGVRLAWSAHAALEAGLMLKREAGTAPGLLVLRLGLQGGILLAHEGPTIVAARSLTVERLTPALLEGELEATVAYLQRHGWPARDALPLRLLGLAPLPPGNPCFARQQAHADADPKAELLAQLFQSGHPRFALDAPRLVRRRRLLRLGALLDRAALTALLLAVLSVGTMQLSIRLLTMRTNQLQQLAAPLPPAILMPPRSTLQALTRQLDAIGSLAPALPDQSPRSYTYKADSSGDVTLRWLAEDLPDLSGWQPLSAPARQASGLLESKSGAVLQSTTLRFTGEAP